jgi:hypothetical protein
MMTPFLSVLSISLLFVFILPIDSLVLQNSIRKKFHHHHSYYYDHPITLISTKRQTQQAFVFNYNRNKITKSGKIGFSSSLFSSSSSSSSVDPINDDKNIIPNNYELQQ